MSDDAARLYTSDEWAAMTERDRELVAEARRRAVEDAHAEHQRLVDSLTTERFTIRPRDGR
jgi:hypothetical protein